MEIERKFAIKYIPGQLSEYEMKEIEQGYLCNNPVVRIRKSNNDYILTYKSKKDLEKSNSMAIIRNEIEMPLTKEAYDTLRKKTEGNLVYKKRYLIPLENELVAELDIFEGRLHGLIFAEVEFTQEQEADKFISPEWFGIELTQDKRFSNYHLSKLDSCEDLLL